MISYYLSLEAENDLEEIWIFGLDNWGLKQADDYHGQLISMCRYLSENPLLGKSQDYIAEGLRSYSCGSHRLFYMVSNDEGAIRVSPLYCHSTADIDEFLTITQQMINSH